MRFCLSIPLAIWSLLSGFGSARCEVGLERRACTGLDSVASEIEITVKGETNNGLV